MGTLHCGGAALLVEAPSAGSRVRVVKEDSGRRRRALNGASRRRRLYPPRRRETSRAVGRCGGGVAREDGCGSRDRRWSSRGTRNPFKESSATGHCAFPTNREDAHVKRHALELPRTRQSERTRSRAFFSRAAARAGGFFRSFGHRERVFREHTAASSRKSAANAFPETSVPGYGVQIA
ncbi:hypothetical protein MTO96_002650 [Rhipicephalus appendiculatus]